MKTHDCLEMPATVGSEQQVQRSHQRKQVAFVDRRRVDDGDAATEHIAAAVAAAAIAVAKSADGSSLPPGTAAGAATTMGAARTRVGSWRAKTASTCRRQAREQQLRQFLHCCQRTSEL